MIVQFNVQATVLIVQVMVMIGLTIRLWKLFHKNFSDIRLSTIIFALLLSFVGVVATAIGLVMEISCIGLLFGICDFIEFVLSFWILKGYIEKL